MSSQTNDRQDSTNISSPPSPTTTAIISTSLLECSICLSLLAEPVSIPCGHTFCRTCLMTAMQRTQKRCPLCRSVCVIDASTQSENVHLSAILKTCFGSLYAERLRDCESVKDGWKMTLPIFFFNDALFPTCTLRLHLFEPRYKLMIRRALEGNRCFAYVPNFTDYTPRKGDVGLVAKVVECQFLHDGRALLEAQVTLRFKITDHWVEEGTSNLFYCQYERFEDVEEDDDELAQLREVAIQNIQNFRLLLEALSPIRQFSLKEALGEFPSDKTNTDNLCWWMAKATSRVGCLPEEEKIALLKSDSLKRRLERVNRAASQLFGRW